MRRRARLASWRAASGEAKRELAWTLRFPSWRQGFAEAYATLRTSSSEPGVPKYA
jgi:hypothetical protein